MLPVLALHLAQPPAFEYLISTATLPQPSLADIPVIVIVPLANETIPLLALTSLADLIAVAGLYLIIAVQLLPPQVIFLLVILNELALVPEPPDPIIPKAAA